MTESTVAVSAVKFRDDLYPRIATSAETVQKYADDLSVLPPIQVNQHNELIDGWHRWTAHKKARAEEIAVEVVETTSDAHLLELAIVANAKHGLQLSLDDKRTMARNIYHVTPERERDEKKQQLAKILSVSDRVVRLWLSRIDKDSKAARAKQVFDLWLACHTQQEVATLLDISQPTVAGLWPVLSETANLPNLIKPSALFKETNADGEATFVVPLYNVWKFKENTAGSSHPGNSNTHILDRLLYLYTEPFDVVVDPFAGGGSTIDICKKRTRRYFVSDRAPVVERKKEIRNLDVTSVIPGPARWSDVKLVYLDPPYWKQMEGKYSDDSRDLANMDLDLFHGTLARVIRGYAKKLKPGSVIALLIQPTQWKEPEKRYTDHVAELLKAVKLPLKMRVSCPYESQQCTPTMVAWAKENREVLVLSRELVIWECGA